LVQRYTHAAAPHSGSPFDHPDWLYELKSDGFRALALVTAIAMR
jgi:hypothetical protein